MSTRINSTPSINQLLERLSRINPNKRRGPTRRTENLSVLFCPFDDEAGWVVGHLIERLVDDGPASDMWGKIGETRVAGKVFVQEETEQEEDDEFGDTDGLVHFVRSNVGVWLMWLFVWRGVVVNMRLDLCGETCWWGF
jgi:hypothetical protein